MKSFAAKKPRYAVRAFQSCRNASELGHRVYANSWYTFTHDRTSRTAATLVSWTVRCADVARGAVEAVAESDTVLGQSGTARSTSTNVSDSFPISDRSSKNRFVLFMSRLVSVLHGRSSAMASSCANRSCCCFAGSRVYRRERVLVSSRAQPCPQQ